MSVCVSFPIPSSFPPDVSTVPCSCCRSCLPHCRARFGSAMCMVVPSRASLRWMTATTGTSSQYLERPAPQSYDADYGVVCLHRLIAGRTSSAAARVASHSSHSSSSVLSSPSLLAASVASSSPSAEGLPPLSSVASHPPAQSSAGSSLPCCPSSSCMGACSQVSLPLYAVLRWL